jgi:AcrR family transcriptional regulator
MAAPVTRRRGDAEETRRRVLDAVVATVIDVGYYKASSNEIARRAGVTWGSIQHLFGSREQLMLDVVNDFGARLERGFANGVVEGDTLEERLRSVFDVLATHYEQDTYLVQVQILLDRSANPKMSARGRRAIRRNSGQVFDSLARPLLTRALGELAAERDLLLCAFMTMRGYLVSVAIARHIAEFPEGTILRLIVAEGEGSSHSAPSRDLILRGVAAMVREEATRRGYDVDAAVLRPLREEPAAAE